MSTELPAVDLRASVRWSMLGSAAIKNASVASLIKEL